MVLGITCKRCRVRGGVTGRDKRPTRNFSQLFNKNLSQVRTIHAGCNNENDQQYNVSELSEGLQYNERISFDTHNKSKDNLPTGSYVSRTAGIEYQLTDMIETVNDTYRKLNDLQAKVRENIKYLEHSSYSANILQQRLNVESRNWHGTNHKTEQNILDIRGLESSMELEKGLMRQWYAVAFADQMQSVEQFEFELLGKKWVIFLQNGQYYCANKAFITIVGVENLFSCGQNAKGEILKCVKKHNLLWVCPDNSLDEESIPNLKVPEGFAIHAEIEVEVPVEHGLLMENLLDLAHAPFTHTSTFAKGWSIPDLVKFHTTKMLGGEWDPYPIDMSFEPPCIVLSTIGLAQPGKILRGLKSKECQRHLHQVHVCLPSRKGHTRLLYRMSLDFMNWLQYVPKIGNVWQQVANQVLGEDLVLVLGQQDRLIRGGNTWANPVSYDKLAVRYRRWRNSLKNPDKGVLGKISMDAAQLFSLED
eukprot:TRINITY_DN27996_c1_g1_i1.p1 TRINITY_DN27996_c1_g1~~TRINITY_DN27996_c1_g1_i1.p1  ORF type:complete len:476 (-),score=17.32 TRINITY_DN27996_c1_g1_i1:418-1845(-)